MRARPFGDRGGVGGDDGARLLEVAQLERDGRADHLGLELQRDRQRAHPVEPVVAGALEKLARGGIDGGLEGLIGPKDQGHGLDQREWRLMRDVGERAIGGQAQRVGASGIADVVGADRARGAGTAVVEGRPDPDGDARQAGDRLDAAEDLRRIEDALEAFEARREIGDAKGIAAGVAHGGLDDRRVAHVGGFARHRPSITTSQKPFSSSPASSRENTGSASKRGKHHHTMRTRGSVRAAMRQFPMTARSRGPPSVGVAGSPTRRLVA